MQSEFEINVNFKDIILTIEQMIHNLFKPSKRNCEKKTFT